MVTASPSAPTEVHVLRCLNKAGGRVCNRQIGSSSKQLRAVRVIRHVKDIRSNPDIFSSYCAHCKCATEFEPEEWQFTQRST